MIAPVEDGSSIIEVLLIEDNPRDVRLTREAFRDANKAIHLSVVFDGVEAMAFLRREGPHAHARRPDLILLDLNLPKQDGWPCTLRIYGPARNSSASPKLGVER